MSHRCPRILLLPILAISFSCYAQSLGDVARQTCAERQQNSTPPAKVITNDDIANSEQAAALPSDALPYRPKNEGEGSPAATSSAGADKALEAGAESDESRNGKSSDKISKDPAKERESQELETQKRTREINQRYLDQIATLRAQLNTAQAELAKLQREQAESTNDFRRTLGVSPNPSIYIQQQRLSSEQMETQRNSIKSLNSQLEDAVESARHAGVPHASE